jgi:ADP-heptose:LPS heptosyltransferase
MICALAVVRRLRAAFPRARIDMLASERNANLVAGLVDHVHVYRKGRGLLRNHYFNLPRVVAPIRAANYDVVIAIAGGFSKLLAVVTYATRIPCRIGFVPREGHPLAFSYNVALSVPDVREHQIERCLRLLQPLGINDGLIDVTFPLGIEHETYARQFLIAHELKRRCFAVYNASSTRASCTWPTERIAALAVELKRRAGLPLVICCTPEDQALLERIREAAGESLVTVATPTVHHFAALVRQARILITGDGGPAHVAAAMKTPAFVLFGAAEPEIWRPYGVPYAYVKSGGDLARLAVPEVLGPLLGWLPTVPSDAVS